MPHFLLRVLFSAFMLSFVLPMVPGFHFLGAFWPEGIIYGVLLAFVSWLLAWLLDFFVVGTLGLGAILLLFFFWLVPALQLELLAGLFPAHLVIDHFGSAIAAGLVMFVVNLLLHSTQR